MSDFIAEIERIRRSVAAIEPVYDWTPSVEPPPPAHTRKLVSCIPPARIYGADSLEAARELLRASIQEYLDEAEPREMLLLKSLPGTGKTTASVGAVETLAEAGRRVAYAGPRHALFPDVLAKARQPSYWYEWLPRQAEDPDSGKVQTCLYSRQIGEWINRGYSAMDFCAGVCRWDYVNSGCVYHAQKRRPEPIIFIQHQHVTGGHPLPFSILFGDESPLAAFTHEWRIPARYILPEGMDHTDPLTEILHILSLAAQNTEKALEGEQLLLILGGAQAVYEACAGFEIPAGQLSAAGEIHRPEEVENKPYFHLFDLVPLLKREAGRALTGATYPHRIIVSQGKMTLLLRHAPRNLSPHLIWMDATARPEVYERLFGRPARVVDASPPVRGRVYQVVDRANGKQTLTASTGSASTGSATGQPTPQARQTATLIRRIIEDYEYLDPSLISFKSFNERIDLQGIRTGHFYAARGTNEHEAADAMLVVGAPQPNIYDVVKMAKMIYFERDAGMQVIWATREVPYRYVAEDGQGRAYPVSGFWHDPDLQTILEIMREDEIIQAAHRARPVNHEVDIWLLTNIPVDGLPPTKLLTMREIMGTPQGVNTWKWARVETLLSERNTISMEDLMALGLNRETARAYLERISQLPGWDYDRVSNGKRGRPTVIVQRRQAD